MSLIRALYQGRLIPMEMEMTKTKKLRDAAKRVREVSKELQEALNEEQWELYESHEDARSMLEDMEQEELFVLGFKLGLRLGKEVWEEDPIKRMEEKICR
ncbi:MAG: hypothetical protein E7616_08945 [Ruminococcaceae bacterium]|nr:hypothetical protein [Oscillospiraceae bacterium]